ncbi:hypothetical protein BGAL_0828g00030 [Botrytis galanthina]|uniref:Peptidase metallopeptidase domain-containing protein n=1 Tax=Botrytis galanthina TaxID=278940 RepID=A0A4S8QGT8_9HELO|nr:hypothetical protein BGAL_0828g00030 [Botrytis galanthina]
MSIPISADDLHEVHTCAILRPACGTPLPPSGEKRDSGGFDYLVLDPKFYWNPGDEITVSFIKPDSQKMVINDWNSLKKKVEAIAREWEFANIRFTFNDSSDAQIRIGFFPGAGGFSALGTDCTSIAPGDPTMYLGKSTDVKTFRSSVLHEFGHVLGCLHEHSSPLSDIQWDENQVYLFYKAKHEKNKDWVDEQILKPLKEYETDHSSFDPLSIMIYPIDKALTKNGVSVKPPSDISLKDKAFMQQIYPPNSVPDIEGVFYSWKYKKWDRRDPKNTAFVPFEPELTTIPAVAVGLVQFDMDSKVPLRIKATAACITPQSFNIQTETWDGSDGLFSAGATWFKIDDPKNSDFRIGMFDTAAYQPDRELLSSLKYTIKFKRAFESPPEVVVWIRGFYIETGTDIGLTVSAHEITQGNFEIHIDPKGNTKLHRAMATWVAYPKDKKGIFSGSTVGQQMKVWPGEKDNRRGYSERFDLTDMLEQQGCDWTKFRVWAGVNSFDISGEHNVRLHTEVEKMGQDVCENSFWIHMKTWNDTDCRSASSSYLAVFEEG